MRTLSAIVVLSALAAPVSAETCQMITNHFLLPPISVERIVTPSGVVLSFPKSVLAIRTGQPTTIVLDDKGGMVFEGNPIDSLLGSETFEEFGLRHEITIDFAETANDVATGFLQIHSKVTAEGVEPKEILLSGALICS